MLLRQVARNHENKWSMIYESNNLIKISRDAKKNKIYVQEEIKRSTIAYYNIL